MYYLTLFFISAFNLFSATAINTHSRLASGSDFMKNVSSPYIKPYQIKQSECEVAVYASNAGFPAHAIPIMVCISKYESSYTSRVRTLNDDDTTDYGLFQINSFYWCDEGHTSKYNECNKHCMQLLDGQLNANCAYYIWKQQGFYAWYGYQYHKQECDNYIIDC